MQALLKQYGIDIANLHCPLKEKVKDLYDRAKTWFWPRDPLILDLDGDGLETVGLASNVYFDHDGDGVLTRTGWVGNNDALLVWDRNANGRIDTGAELFGDFTVLPNGTLAPNGFAALAALDANGDGFIDASDPAFAELKLWRDASQDGQTGTGELISLVDAGIASLNLAHTLKNQRLANGNTLAREGSFTRVDGTTSAMGEFHLAIDTFDTRFANEIEVPEALKTLPNMQGAGNVRELQQAAAQSGAVAGVLAQFQSAPTRAEQRALLDQLITAWAGTSGMGSLEARAAGKYRIEYEAFGTVRRSTNLDSAAWMAAASGSVGGGAALMTDFGGLYLSERYRNLIAEWSRKLHVLEAFNGQYFFNLPAQKSQTDGANWGLAIQPGTGSSGMAALPTLRVSFSQPQLDLLQQAYDSLKESVYASLVLQTRLKPYLDAIELVIDEQGLRLDASQLNQTLAAKKTADPENYLADLLDLDKYAGNFLSGTNWQGLSDFDTLIETLPQTAGIAALLDEFKVRTLTGGDDNAWLSDKADIVLAGEGQDTLYGYNGNDRLFGQGGDDRIHGGAGDDLISGGAGDDLLYGESGADTYVFGRGYGHDTISDTAENGVQRDSVRFLGLTPADIRVSADHADNLVFTLIDTGETLTVPRGGWWWGSNGVGQYVFDDGTVWSHDDALRASVAASTEGDDVIHGSSAGDTITGQAGNDTLIGHGGNDVIDGGAGNDLLIGATGWNWIYDNGQRRQERNTTPQISANGNDTYRFGRGDGQDTVIDGDYTAGNSDTLRFKEGVAPADVKFIRSGNDLVLAIRGSSDQVTLKQYFDEAWNGANGPWLIERIAFADGTVLSFADVQAILFAGSEEAETIVGSRSADVLTGQGGNDTLIGNGGDDRLEGGDGDDVLLGGAGRDILDGGAGNDVLRGGGVIGWGNQVYDGNGEGDTYRFGRGDGHDTIIEDSWIAGETDRIELKAGVAPADVRLERVRSVNGWQVGDDLKITLRDTGETLTVRNHFNESNRHAVEQIVFADGTRWDAQAIKSQVLLGGDGDDALHGFNGRDDSILGGAGNDRLTGLGGNDTLDAGSGDDILEGGAGDDVLLGGDGRDVLFGDDGDDLLHGAAGDDVLYGGAGNDKLLGGAGADRLFGGVGDDTLDGGAGDDMLVGGAGADTYSFGLGYGHDVAEEDASPTSQGNWVELNDSVAPTDVRVRKVGNDLVIQLQGSNDSLTLRGAATYASGSAFAGVRFADGSSWDYAVLQDRAIMGSDEDDRIEGFDGLNQTFDGGPGNDLILGGTGGNVYLFGRGDGQDVIVDRDPNPGNVDILRFKSGVEPDDIELIRSGVDLVARIAETGDSVTVRNFFLWEAGGWRHRIELIEFADGTRWSANEVQGRATLSPESAHLRGTAGPDSLIGNSLDNLLEGLDGHDVLEGGDGDDILIGGLGADTLRGGAGDDILYGLLRETNGGDSASTLTPTAYHYLYGAGNAIVNGLSTGTPGFGEQYLWRNDDGSTSAIDITPVFGGQGLNFFGRSYTQLYVNNNGNITFGSPLSAYTPSQIGLGGLAIIAPFWADVDTRAGVGAVTPGGNSQGTNLVYYDLDTENGVFTATWDDVGYYRYGMDKLNAVQLQLISRAAGDFDIVFRYEAVNWTAGDASGGSFGLGGTPARAGYSAGNGNPQHYYEIPGSGNQAAMLALDEVEGNTGRIGVHVFHVRSGEPVADNRGIIRNGDTGINLLYGGSGNDTYVVDSTGDVVIEYEGEGIDQVNASVSFSLPDHVEHLTLTGAMGIEGRGNGLDNVIIGNAGANALYGGDGDDLLDGEAGDDVLHGGRGADTLRGGSGRDHLFGGEGGDTYVFHAGDEEVIIDDGHGTTGWHPGAAPNVLVFGPGISQEGLLYSEQNGDLVIEFEGRPSDRVILRGYESGRATRTRSVDIIRFADGSEIVAAGVPDDSGDDLLEARNPGDVLDGRAGSDTYRVRVDAARTGEVLIVETWRANDTNRIELVGDVNGGMLRAEFDGDDLLLRVSADHVVRFVGFDPRAPGMQAPVSEIVLPGGGLMTFAELLARGVRIIGTPNDDVLTGTALADWIEGREADDTMSGGAGADLYLIDADGGVDTIIDTENGDAPNTLVLPEGTTLDDLRLSYDGEGFLVIDLVNTGNRVRLLGFDPQNPLGLRAVQRFRFGIDGDEIGYEELLARGFDIVGTIDADALKGTTLTDRVRGGEGNDLIEATPGGDWLAGEGGNDTYPVKLGDGIVTIDDVAEEDAGNVLRFGPGIDPNVLRNNLRFEADGNGGHVLLIPYGDAGDVVRLTGFDPQDVLGNHAIERFEFADGTAVDYATLVSWTFVVEGDNAGNALEGTNVGDRLYGYDGDDVMESGDGEDVLTGGLGNDVLRGGAQRDAYVVNLGDGEDVIEDSVEAGIGNVLTFGAGIRREDVRLEVDGDDLLIHYGAHGDVVRVSNYAPDGASGGTVIDTFEFADGTTVTLREFMNRAPEVANPIDDQVVLEDAAFSLVLPDGLFIDADGDDILTRITVSGYTTLPDWLQYDAATRTLFGTPDNDDVGEFDVIVQGMDALGASTLHSFRVTVRNTNDAPEVAMALADQQATEDAPFAFTVPQGAYRDVDAGDVLTLSATQADGSALPSWLAFDAATGTFAGTPTNEHVGSLAVRLTATDLAGASASQTFAIAVANTNDAPEVGVLLTNQTGRVGQTVSWQLPQGAFLDVDAGDVLTYSATLANGDPLPAWLTFDAASGTFSGTPTEPGSLSLRVTATDLAGAQAHQRFAFEAVAGGGNLPPVTAPDAANVSEDCKLVAWGNVLANDRDPEGQRLTVTDAGIRRGEYGWLKLRPDGGYAYVLDNASARVQGLAEGQKVVDRFAYTASDGSAASPGELAVTVTGDNDAPVLAKALADVQLARGKAFSWQIPAGSFKDIDRTDTLTYTATLANGKALPSWLKFDAATQTFSGTAPSGSTAAIDVRVVASDGHGACSTASDVFRISIGNKTVLPTAAKGNEGVGNGADAPPPGHAVNQNDGAGTGPGNPGNKGKNAEQDLLDRFLDGFKMDAKAASNKNPLGSLDAGWFDRWLTPPAQANGQAVSSGNGQAVEAHWRHLLQALNRLDAERQGAAQWLGKGQGADLSGLTGLLSSGNAMLRTHGDPVGLAAGAELKGFTGLREGAAALRC